MIKFADVFSVVVFIAFLALFLYVLIKGYIEWTKKNVVRVTKITAFAESKRTTEYESDKKRTKTAYFITFLPDEGEPFELRVSPKEFEEIKKGDKGLLTYQGTRFLCFEPKKSGEAKEKEE